MTPDADPVQLGLLIVSIIAVAITIIGGIITLVWAAAKMQSQTSKLATQMEGQTSRLSSELHGMSTSIDKLDRTLESIERRQEKQEIRLTVLEKTAFSHRDGQSRQTLKRSDNDVGKD